MQPGMEAVLNVLPPREILLRVSKKAAGSLARFTSPTWDEHLKTRWQALASELGEADAAAFWHGAVQRGGVYREPPAPPQVAVVLESGKLGYTKPTFEGDGSFTFLTYPHPMLHDGRGTNKPWLMENADPVTKITWHSWVEVSPTAAQALDVRNGEILELTSPYGTVEAPVYVYPGIRDDAVAIPLGFGHTAYGPIAQGRGVNALDLLCAPHGEFVSYLSTRVSLRKTGGYRKLASVQGVPRQLGRGIAESVGLEAARKGLTVEQAYAEAGHGKHEINTEQELEAIHGWSEAQKRAATHGDYTRDLPQW